MLRQEIARVEEMIDEKLAAFKAELLAELKPEPEPKKVIMPPKGKSIDKLSAAAPEEKKK